MTDNPTGWQGIHMAISYGYSNKKEREMSKLDRVLDELFWLAIYSIPAVFVVICVSGIVYGMLFM